MARLPACFIIAPLLLGLTAAALADPRVDRLMAAYRGRPGVAVAVVRQGRVIVNQGYGLANLKTRAPITAHSRFDLASVSKQFTAMVVLIECERGHLALSDPLRKFFPSIAPYAGSVTVEQLLSMTSGLPDYDDAGLVTLRDLLADLAAGKPGFPPGRRFEYLNMNYALLTRVVEKVTGQGFGEVLRELVLKPVGMRRTAFLGKNGQAIPGRVTGYRSTGKGGWKVSLNDAPGTGDGNVFSCSEDLAKWAIHLLGGSTLISPALQKRAWTAGQGNYGFGWEVADGCVWHSGAWDGTSTYIALYPQKRLGIVILSNNEDEDVERLGERLEKIYAQAGESW